MLVRRCSAEKAVGWRFVAHWQHCAAGKLRREATEDAGSLAENEVRGPEKLEAGVFAPASGFHTSDSIYLVPIIVRIVFSASCELSSN